MNAALTIFILFFGTMEFTNGFTKSKVSALIPLYIWYWMIIIMKFDTLYANYSISSIILENKIVYGSLLIFLLTVAAMLLKKQYSLKKVSYYMEQKKIKIVLAIFLFFSMICYYGEFKYSLEKLYLLALIIFNIIKIRK